MTSTVVLDATGTVVGSAGMVFEATGGSQGQPGCRRGCRMSLRDYYTSVSYNMYKRNEDTRGFFGNAAVVLEVTGSVLSTNGRVLEATGGFQGLPGGINGYRRGLRY